MKCSLRISWDQLKEKKKHENQAFPLPTAIGQVEVVVPLDDNVAPHLYDPLVDYIISRAGLAGQERL